MEGNEGLDREVIIERAEAVRFWLLGLNLSNRATGAIQRELGAIIANDPGEYINGQRPLAGLSVDGFIEELHSPNGGAVGRVQRVGASALNELRAAIPAATGVKRPQAKPAPTAPEPEAPELEAPELEAPEPEAPELETPELETPEPETPEPETPELETPEPADIVTEAAMAETPEPTDMPNTESGAPEAQPARRRGRPKGSTNKKKAALNGVAVPQPQSSLAGAQALASLPPTDLSATEEPKRRRGRPRREDTRPAVSATISATLLEVSAPPVNSSSAEASAPPKTHEPIFAGTPAAPVAPERDDLMLKQLTRLWRSLHPHARRAVVMYASTLWAEDNSEL